MKLFLEIRVENFPSKDLLVTLQKMENIFKEEFVKEDIQFNNLSLVGTNRRFVLSSDISYSSEDSKKEITGPPEVMAFTEGELNNLGKSFIKSKNILEDTIFIKERSGKKYLCGLVIEKKKSLSKVIEDVLKEVLKKTKFKKSMKWSGVEFLRPIRSIVGFVDKEFLKIEIGNICSTKSVEYKSNKRVVEGYEDYFTFVKENNILIDFKDREEKVAIENLEKSETYYEALNTVENPKLVLSNFEDKYLSLPQKLIEGAIDKYQMGLPLHNEDGSLKRDFYLVCEEGVDESIVSKSNSNIINSRLADAKIFYEQDIKIGLEKRGEELEGILFQRGLGTISDKVKRLLNVFEKNLLINKRVSSIEDAIKAIKISKNDLATLLIREKEYFHLRGYIGSIYAKEEGMNTKIQKILLEQYLPGFDGDSLPSIEESAILSILDKMDNISGAAILNKLPSGASDPIYIRRDAIGILNIIEKFSFNISLKELFNNFIDIYEEQGCVKGDKDKIKEYFNSFMIKRCEQFLLKSYDKKFVNSVLKYWDNLIDLKERAEAVRKAGEKIVELAKRVYNISKDHRATDVNESLFLLDEEKNLFDKIESLEDTNNYMKRIEDIENLSEDISKFFDKVIVMDKDEQLKSNRLNLLSLLLEKINSVAEMNKIIF